MITESTTLRDDLARTLNKHSAENGSDTPDFILVKYLLAALEAFDNASREREKWYGKSLAIGPLITEEGE